MSENKNPVVNTTEQESMPLSQYELHVISLELQVREIKALIELDELKPKILELQNKK